MDSKFYKINSDGGNFTGETYIRKDLVASVKISRQIYGDEIRAHAEIKMFGDPSATTYEIRRGSDADVEAAIEDFKKELGLVI